VGACTVPGNFFIVQEYLFRGDVEKMLRNPDLELSLFIRMRWAKDAALGMNWLHKNNPIFIHRDLKTSNLLIDENDRVKVCDFGLSEVKQQGQMLQDTDRAKGTPLWMAPEIMMFQKFNEKVDVYSYGIVCWELLTRQIPFRHHSNYEKFKRAVCLNHERPDIPVECEESLRNLINNCWDKNPNKRPSFTEIINDLDDVIIDVALKDPVGRRFWKAFYLHEENVVYDKFESEILQFMLTPAVEDMTNTQADNYKLNKKCLKVLLSKSANTETDNKEYVNVEDFNRFLSFFGPLKESSECSWDANITENVRLLLQKSWFHGDISTNQSVNLLKHRPEGSFLIRFSSVEGYFTISQNNQGKVKHQRFKRDNSKYTINEAEYDTIEDLIRGQQLNVTLPCPGSVYLNIFETVPDDDGNGYGYTQ